MVVFPGIILNQVLCFTRNFYESEKMIPLLNLIVEKASWIVEEFEVCLACKDVVLLCCN